MGPRYLKAMALALVVISPVHAATASVARTNGASFIYAGSPTGQAFIATGFIDGVNSRNVGGELSAFRTSNCDPGNCARQYAAITGGSAERLPWITGGFGIMAGATPGYDGAPGHGGASEYGGASDYGSASEYGSAPGFGGASEAAGGMSRQDFALMMLFAGALVAYQLDRKQRVLRQSSLSELSL
jgi:hypothetical protein